MAYDKLTEINRKRQLRFIGRDVFRFGISDSAAARGADLDIDSDLEQVLEEIAFDTVDRLKQSAIKKGFRQNGNLVQGIGFGAVVKGNSLYTIQIQMADHFMYAEEGRKKGKRPPLQPIIEWIGRTPSVQQSFFNQPKWKGKINTIYKMARNNRPLAYRSAAWLISRAIGSKGTIKRFGYKGSKFISSVLNKKYEQDLSNKIAERTGLAVAIYISEL